MNEDRKYPSPADNAVGFDKLRNAVLEEAAKAAETAQICGSLMRPGIAKVIRAMKTADAPENIAALVAEYEIDQWWVDELTCFWGDSNHPVTLDTRRAAKVAINFVTKVLTNSTPTAEKDGKE